MNSFRSDTAAAAVPTSNGKAPAANAWARPLQAKPGPPPGMGPPSSAAKAPLSNGASTILRERFLHLNLALVGQKVTITQTNGAVLEGILHTFTPFTGLSPEQKNKYVLKATKTVKPAPDGTTTTTISEGATVILPADKVLYLQAKNINLARPAASNGSDGVGPMKSGALVTDTEISKGRAGGNRDLVAAGSAWTTSAGGKTRAEGLAGALDDKRKGFGTANNNPSGLSGSIGQWDQFKANQELFNVNASYDENLYTTELDKSQIDARKIAEAERIAKEIETTTSSNLHVAEERGHAVETDYDEEDRYSGVLTKEGKNRHQAAVASKDPKLDGPKLGEKSATAAVPKKMNYAAAAAKADAAKKAAPPGFIQKGAAAAKTQESKPADNKAAKITPNDKKETEAVEESKAENLKPKAPEAKAADNSKPAESASSEKAAKKAEDDKKAEDNSPKTESIEEKTAKTKKETGEEKAKTKLKLNPGAKSFTFNPGAKSFTPSFGGAAPAAPPQQPPSPSQNANMQMQSGGHPMQAPHYMHGVPMGQQGKLVLRRHLCFSMCSYSNSFVSFSTSGMMPMMSPQFPGVRYQHPYPGMDQHAAQLQPQQPQHAQVAPASSGAATDGQAPAAAGEEESVPVQEGDASQQSVAPPQQPQQLPMPYSVPPPGAAPYGHMYPMQPRGPGYPPQFVGGPQQMPVRPGASPYGHNMYPMQPGGMPPNMHMRGPGGAPYYPGPNGPMPYPPNAYSGHGMMDDSDPNFRGRGGGRSPAGRRGRGRGGSGRGRGGRGGNFNGYNQQQQHGGRQTPQQQVPAGQSGAPGEGPSPQDAAAQSGDTSNTSASANE